MCLILVCSPPAGWLCTSDRSGRHSSVLTSVFIVTLWCKVTTPSLSMIFHRSWVQGTAPPNLTRGPARRWICLSLQISLLDQMILFPFYIAGTVLSVTAVSKICHKLVSITRPRDLLPQSSHLTTIYGSLHIITVQLCIKIFLNYNIPKF